MGTNKAQVAVLDIKFVINTPRTNNTTNTTIGDGLAPRLFTIISAITLPVPVLTIASPRAMEPAKSIIVFISIDFTAAVSPITLVATKTSAPTQALT